VLPEVLVNLVGRHGLVVELERDDQVRAERRRKGLENKNKNPN
jgi:hypothetical protein